jgi:hypothetical protein
MKAVGSIRLLMATCGLMVGCGHGMRREDGGYRDATREMLASRNHLVKRCYDDVLSAQPELGGRVAVAFRIAPGTGQVTEASVDEDVTTAPARLRECVVKAIAGLALNPPDEKEARATFVWEFKPGAP